ncbi:hypothetical protein ABV436_002688 [Vibrio parahaemolyticus]|uniref:glycosyltransferase n=1 Tax=Vibrio parahaemolyticus TaxID=670 RepID=UPI0006ACC8B7|nr:glycosyltransferase [Vibrio parahaemolyticus]EJG1648729.1 hypothetical protein [Vibrio parahaemolyticus]EMA2529754.1 hypothetical protein [Vibrio parahaemolyticus]KOF33500.1 hypothetical protein ACX04_10635 [Vibrio parahaemolyticus]MBM5016207.1 hypothetical protein [Vibrio parahaemolyticus]MBM5126014.1 hypothetical protein [Vibrio parahaemolyticus]
MKICFIETSWPHNSRTNRFKESFKNEGYDVISVGWDRKGSKKNSENGVYVKCSNIGYGKPIKKMLSLGSFLLYIYNVLKKEKPDVLFMAHWDSLLLGSICRLLLKSDFKLIYDCLDMPTSSYKPVSSLILGVDKKLASKCNAVFFASRYFKQFYTIKDNRDIVFENYPSTTIVSKIENKLETFSGLENLAKEKKIISWIGVVRYFDILKNLIDATAGIKGSHVCFFGDGPDLSKVEHYINLKGYSHVSLFGRYKFEDVGQIYQKSDLIWAAYPTKDFNVRYAISNKYFECNYFKKTPIFSKNTMIHKTINGVSDSVLFVDEYSCNDIRETIMSHNTHAFEKYEDVKFWEDEFLKIIPLVNAKLSTIKNGI